MNRRSLTASILLGSLALSASPVNAAEPWWPEAASPMAPIVLRVGTDTILAFPGVTKSQVGDEKLGEACTMKDDRVHVNALALGSTTLTIWTSKGKVIYSVLITL